jgi:hypothetical protein
VSVAGCSRPVSVMCDVLGGVELACPAASAAEANAAIVQNEMIAARRFMLRFLS